MKVMIGTESTMINPKLTAADAEIAAGRFRSVPVFDDHTLNVISCPSCSRVENEKFVELAEAVRGGQEYTWRTLAAGYRPGMGQFIPDRLFWSREEDEDAEAG